MMLHLILVLLRLHGAAEAKHHPRANPVDPSAPKWPTLTGYAPAVVARGGYSGLFPESSLYAYQLAQQTSLRDVVLFCDLQLTQDGAGFCHSDLRLDNSTTISSVFPKRQKTYDVNGQSVRGWFSVDYSADQLINNVSLIQNIFSRPSVFDGSESISMVEDVAGLRARLWLNVQYDMFFKQHKLDVTEYILSASGQVHFDYISSPEINFLKGINGKLGKSRTKFIFRFLDANVVEPSTNQTYGSFLKDLQTIKSFASGILVPKNYIWPVNEDQYLEPPTTLVTDAHKLGLEVYASGFANDLPASYNYSFDPTAEYLQFVDNNSNFTVDGVLTDFPSTASEAIACLAYNKNDNAPAKGRPLIITHNGASGVFAGCTDLAYQQAVKDGADIIDCSVQISKDGIAFCLDSADLLSDTTAMTSFMSRASMVTEIQSEKGIFSFDLTWSEIQSLKPKLTGPLSQSGLYRNPAAKNQGKFMTLAEFLDFAKNSTVSGVLISIENAAYLASKKGLDIVDAVSSALTNASYDRENAKQVFIQSCDSSVLSPFEKNTSYKRVLYVNETISDAPKTAVDEIKKFADVVNLPRSSIIANSDFFFTEFTNVVKKMHAANISVYASVFRNEYTTMAFDCFSDPMVELATYFAGAGVDGLVTEFPATATAYFRSPCSPSANLSYTILPAEPGSLLSAAAPGAVPPAQAPAPALTAADVVDPPLPPVMHLTEKAPALPPASTTSPSGSGQPKITVNVALYLFIAVLSYISMSYH